MNTGRKNWMLVGVGLLLAAAAVLLVSGGANAACTVGDCYSGSGNWVINNPTTVSDMTIDVSGNINVFSTLTVSNTNIRFTGNGYTFTVFGSAGGLTMSPGSGSTTVTTTNTSHFWLFNIQNSTANVNVQNVTLVRVQDGVTVNGGTAASRYFAYVTVVDAKSYGFRLLNSYASIINVNVTVQLVAITTRSASYSNYSYIYNSSPNIINNYGYQQTYFQYYDYVNAIGTGVYVSGGGPWIDGVETHVPATSQRIDLLLAGQYTYIGDWRNYYKYYYGGGTYCDTSVWYGYFYTYYYGYHYVYPKIEFYGVYADTVNFALFNNVRPPPETMNFDVHYNLDAKYHIEEQYCGVYADYYYDCSYCNYYYNYLYWDVANVVGVYVKNGGLGNSFEDLDMRMGDAAITITSDWNAPQAYIDSWLSYYARFPKPQSFAFWNLETYTVTAPAAVTPVDFTVKNSKASGGGVRFDRVYTYTSTTATVFRGAILIDNVTATRVAGTGFALNITADSSASMPSYDYDAQISNSTLVAQRSIFLSLQNPRTKATDYQADILFENNVMRDGNLTPDPVYQYEYQSNDPCINQYSYRYYYSDFNGILTLDTGRHCQNRAGDRYRVDVMVKNNLFQNVSGPLFGWEYSDYSFQGGSTLTFQDNTFQQVRWYSKPQANGGMTQPMGTDAMIKTVANNVSFFGNTFSDIEVVFGVLGGSLWAAYPTNPAYYGFAYCPYLTSLYVYYQYYGYYGCSYPLKTPYFAVQNNTFDNVRTPTVTNGMQSIFLIPGRGYMKFEDNQITNSRATFIHENLNFYSVKYAVEDIDVMFARNTIVNQTSGAVIVAMDPYKGGMPTRIIENSMSDSGAPLYAWAWGFYTNMYPQYRPVENLATVAVVENTFTNMALGGKGAVMLTGRSSLINNTFDGIVGWAAIVELTSKIPSVAGNDIQDSTNGYWFAPVASSGLRSTSTFSDLRIAVSDTAIRMVGGNLILIRMDFTGAQTAVDMRNGFAEIYSSKILVLSGKAAGDASITAYNELGYSVRWANAQGVDSGSTVANALVVTSTPDSRILVSGRTDAAGFIPAKTTQVWKITSLGAVQLNELYLPLKIITSAGGISQTSDLPQLAPGEQLTYFQDYPAYPVLLVDAYVPTVSIGSPSSGSAVGTLNVNIEGYTFERGSGLATQRMRVDGGAWITLPSTTGVSWRVPITVAGEGEHLLDVEVADVAGNSFTMQSRFSVDITAPTLTLQRPLEIETLTNQPVYAVQGHVEPVDSQVTINGASIIVTSRGDFFYNYTLADGLNVLFVAAQDRARNEVVLARTIVFDRYPPFLQVNSPIDRLLTNELTVNIAGRTEKAATVTVNGFPAFVNPVTGTFSLPNVALDTLFAQTENLLVIRAVDRAGNVAYENRTIIADTRAPSIELDLDVAIRGKVEAGQPISANTIDVRGRTDSSDAEFTIAGQDVTLNGLSFSRVIVLAEGLNLIEIKADDDAGNQRTVTLRVIRDTVRPSLTLENPSEPSLLTNQTTLEITGFTDTEGSVVTMVYTDSRGVQSADPVPTIAVGTPIRYRFEYTLQLNTDGNEHPVEVRAADAAGNFESKTFTYTAKVGKPFLEVIGFKPKVTDTFVWVNGTTEAGIDKVTINGQTFDVVDQFFAVRWNLPITEGNYTFTVSIRDDAGNQNVFQGKTEVAVPRPVVVSGPTGGGISSEVMVGGVMGLLGAAIAVLAFALSRRREVE